MESPYRSDNPFAVVFGPLAWGRTYGRLLYMLLCLPLGIAYFTFYVTGLSLGVGLAILLAGLVILLAVALATVPLGLFERELTIHLLGEPVPSPGFRNPDGENVWEWLKDTLSNRVTWTSMLFLMIKFPLGLAAWVATIVALAVSFGVTASPVIVAFGGNVEFGFWSPATPAEALSTAIEFCDYVLVMSVNPGFGGQRFIEPVAPKIRHISRLIRERGLSVAIEVDGGIDPRTAPVVAAAGATWLVAGSAVFGQEDRPRAMDALRNAVGSLSA